MKEGILRMIILQINEKNKLIKKKFCKKSSGKETLTQNKHGRKPSGREGRINTVYFDGGLLTVLSINIGRKTFDPNRATTQDKK